MANRKDGLKLEEAMNGSGTRLWQPAGFPAECTEDCGPVNMGCFKKIPSNTTVHETLILAVPGSPLLLAFVCSTSGMSKLKVCGSFSGLDQLRKKCPQLFEVEGTLCEFF